MRSPNNDRAPHLDANVLCLWIWIWLQLQRRGCIPRCESESEYFQIKKLKIALEGGHVTPFAPVVARACPPSPEVDVKVGAG